MLLLEPDLTGIVSLNGCNRDPARVMSEISSKQICSSEIDAVIVGGAINRPTRILAKVTMVLDNHAYTALILFNEMAKLEVTLHALETACKPQKIYPFCLLPLTLLPLSRDLWSRGRPCVYSQLYPIV